MSEEKQEMKAGGQEAGERPSASSLEAELAGTGHVAGQHSEVTPDAAEAVISANGTPLPLGRAPLAYENPGFLNSADGRRQACGLKIDDSNVERTHRAPE